MAGDARETDHDHIHPSIAADIIGPQGETITVRVVINIATNPLGSKRPHGPESARKKRAFTGCFVPRLAIDDVWPSILIEVRDRNPLSAKGRIELDPFPLDLGIV